MNLRHKTFLFSAAVWAVFGVSGAQGQTQDTSGNGMLKGTYQFRNVAITDEDENDNPTEVTATYGSITFDGNGNYTITGTQVDNTVSGGAPQPYSVTGTYAIGSNGTGYVSNPLYPTDTTGYLYDYGAVAQGVFTGSATESGESTVPVNGVLNDVFVAIPTGSVPTNASFTSNYQMGVLDFAGGSTAILNALFNLSPNGKGGLGTISLNGQASNQNAATLTQSITGATYNFNSNGSATLTVPLPSGTTSANALFTGTKTIFESADGNFILGWNPNGYDLIFGIKAMTGATNSASQGLYFTAALEDAFSFGGADSYYGSSYNTGNANGDQIIHQRLYDFNYFDGPFAEDFGQDDQIQVNADGTTAPSYFLGYEYIFGDGGLGYVAIGTNGFYSLVVGLHAGAFSGPGVYINPVMVYNAASYQPVTASLAPGELITMFGIGLASTTTAVQGGNPAPMLLGGVSATIDGIPCPIFAVNQTGGPAGAPSFVSIIVPYELFRNTTIFADIQITNNGVPSNVVQMYFQDSAPGAFSQTENGLGFADVRDALTGALIDQANPAQPNEYISIYLTGLGTVTPLLPSDGAVPPLSGPYSTSDENTNGLLTVYFNDYGPNPDGTVGNAGTIQYAGLAPGLAGLYQLNVQVPSFGLGSGDDVEIELYTETADVHQIFIPYGAGAATPALRQTAMQRRAPAMRARRHKQAIRRYGRGSKPASASGN